MEKPSTSELSEVRIHIDPDPASDELLVEWKGPGDPACQFNWSLSKRWAITLLCSMGGMVILISASMLAPALNNIGDGLGISESEANMVVSIFVLVFAFGPMVLALLAEVFGHRWVWILSSTWYILWNIFAPLLTPGAFYWLGGF